MNTSSLKALSELINELTTAAEQQIPVTLTVGCPICTVATTLSIANMQISEDGITLTDPDGEEYFFRVSGNISHADKKGYTISENGCVLAIDFKSDEIDPEE